MADDTSTQQPQDEGFLHSLATSVGIDPEAVADTAKAMYHHPLDTAETIGSEAVDETKDLVAHPLDTAKQVGKGVVDTFTNAEAQKTAKARFSQPGAGNKIQGAEEYLTSGIPMVGGNLVKAEEQAGQGNVAGSVGTTVGTVAPLLTETEGAEGIKAHVADTARSAVESAKEGLKSGLEAKAPEGSLEAGFAKLGGKKITKDPIPRSLGAAAAIDFPETDLKQGGHAGGGVASVEELNRPGRFVKVSRSGMLTDQGKTPDFNLRSGEVGYQVKPDGSVAIADGVETPTHKAAIERYAKDVYPTPKPEYVQTIASRGQLPRQTVNLGNVYGKTGQYVGEMPKSSRPVMSLGEQTSQEGGLHYPIKRDGETVGGVLFDKVGHMAKVQWIDGPKDLGPTGVRQLIEEFRKQNPEIKSIVGLRMTGGGAERWVEMPTARKSASADLSTEAASHFGVTDDPKKAGYVLPDGRGLDFSDGGPVRKLDHGTISEVPGVAERGENPRQKFQAKTGAMRTTYAAPNGNQPGIVRVESTKPLSPEQVDWIKKTVGDAPHRVMIDFANEDGKVIGSAEQVVKSGDEVSRVARDAVRDAATSGATPTSKPAPKVSPNKNLQTSAQKYAKAKGMDEINHAPVKVNPERAVELANIYDKAQHAPNDPHVKAAYDALKTETKDQFHHLRDDLGLKFEPQKEDPYQSAGEMMQDVKDNKRLKVFTGSSTGPDHPLSEVDPETGQSYNTLFRWVHDAMGHAAGGHDFTENGEKSATEAHAQMYSDKARPAMRAETEGQTSWFFHNPDVEAGRAKPGAFAEQKATTLPDVSHDWHQIAGRSAAKDEAGGINPRTGKSDSKGVGVELMPELRQPLDHAPSAEDFQNFYEQHKDIFDKNPDLRVGWDNKSAVDGGHEINVGAVGPEAARVAKKLDQKSAFDIGKGEVIPTGGTGLRTNFPNYSMESRLADLRGDAPSKTAGFEHLSQDVYNHLEPDEREYLQGNKTLQRNVMTHYHNLVPSVAETTNAMQAGAALGGWWKRYIDVFHNLAAPEAEKVADTIGPSHAEVLKQWHAAVSANKSVEDANNLAWHTYADWLDAGKPTDRKSINDIVVKNAAQPEGSGKKGNAAISDSFDRKGRVAHPGVDTDKLFGLVNSPEMRGERPFSGDVFREDAKNPLMGPTEGARKVPSMGATVAGKGNLNRLVIDTHIRDFYGQKQQGSAPQYIADSAHMRQAAKALGLKGGEGQEQLWGTVLGVKTLLKEGLTPDEVSGKLNADVINRIGKDYAEVIANDPEITGTGGLLDRLKEQYGIGSGSSGAGKANSAASSARTAGEGGQASSQASVDKTLLAKTAERVLAKINPVKIRTPAVQHAGRISAVNFLDMLSGLKNPPR